MKTVLTRALLGFSIAILINSLVYAALQSEANKEILVLVASISICCTIPFILGYIFAYLTDIRYTFITYALAGVLFIFNTLFSMAIPILTFFFASYSLLALLGFSYLVVGYYVFYETVNETGNTKRHGLKREDVLDDNL